MCAALKDNEINPISREKTTKLSQLEINQPNALGCRDFRGAGWQGRKLKLCKKTGPELFNRRYYENGWARKRLQELPVDEYDIYAATIIINY